MLNFFATCAKGLEPLLFEELLSLGAEDVKQTNAGCYFKGDQLTGYRMCLWSRLASRILMHLDKLPVTNRDELLQASTDIDWPLLFSEQATIAIDFRGTTDALNHSQFSARVVKDGIVDRFREDQHARPNVDAQNPDIRINVRLQREQATFYLDLSGSGLHKRGYRSRAGAAPLRETLAAAVVSRAGLHEIEFDSESAIADIFCGSGTLLLEAAQVATDRAPGLNRTEWGFTAWRGHRPALWNGLLAEAEERFAQGKAKCKLVFVGVDTDAKVLQAASENARDLELESFCEWRQGDALETDINDLGKGLMITNPPYGERMGDDLAVLLLYRQLGQRLREHFVGWKAAVLAPEAVLLKRLKLTSHKKYKLFNGAIPVTLALFDVNESQVEFTKSHNDDLANRLRKNAQKLTKWARKEGVNCYRLYDADLPEYNAAIDVYDDHLVIQEYAAPSEIPEGVADDRFWHLLETIPGVLPFTEQQMTVKQRRKQQGKQQYQKEEETETVEREVQEYNTRFKVNLSDYLDTGLFLDHRIVRKEIQRLARDKKVLNLFAYTGTASVHAAVGGATHVTTVDMSNTYLNWAKDNFRLNHETISKHDFIQADCLTWMAEQKEAQAETWDLIFLDPPTFSNSKRMQDSFDVQRDHMNLIADAKALLAEQGLLIFSTNKRKFKLDHEALTELGLKAEDKSKWSVPQDFARNPNIHQCWFITHV
ncbi:bifunctional 23S rRNA (guanine(2069)-N(7))-methyltransferase RlmK/23S rRNA (guanine(2445)-N(2))-methyltransferase RlmL [Aliidiomarina minuta]|uniref:Ribosomal RNA large subunit methyltransferase K/L n=1 Tax=Aliidiomarina minuta TaxID=880057 RepID=A0A432W6W4_9GAMM|nr:bifunctional 23S rRNA (guanine(2069)-N(7))-methyltransferase RlmK/23S rRNA (guanine(2445)-N(2))-methyltransferase RlmL [Aliidiomarina minuta]RUO25706.1 bifunctional 23S rRNA (guanine(2069)-N(7))-methyltransferase RlmK/23S rRNA (guanine(2445)-N(2))-methyltransferase RlmL [Aliidiomarina minuta]